MGQKSYYKEQLEGIPKSEYPTTIKIKNDKGETKWLSLNPESTRDLTEWLKKLEF